MWYLKHIKTGKLITNALSIKFTRNYSFLGDILNINEGKTSIGRRETTHIIQNDDSISRKHCTFLLDKNELKITDDGAKYGTTIDSNQKKVKVTKNPLVLKTGDVIQFGCFGNVWKVHCEAPKRKHDEVEAASDENSLSNSNVSKKLKDNSASTVEKLTLSSHQ